MSNQSSKSAWDNRANQLNPSHPAYHQSRGVPSDQAQQIAERSKPAQDNRANQLNPNNAATKATSGEPRASSSVSASSNPSSAKPK